MKAVQYRTIGAAPEVVTLPEPEPGPGQVLLKVTAAGVCHSDIAVMSRPAESLPYELPLTLGHEGAGTVAGLGAGVTGLAEGDSVAVYGPWGCGTCIKCAEGKENYCLRAGELGIHPPGLGAPGAMAEYMVVDSPRHLVPLGDLNPVGAVPLTDAGLTPYHAIKRSLAKLTPAPPRWSSVPAVSGMWPSSCCGRCPPRGSSRSTSPRTSSRWRRRSVPTRPYSPTNVRRQGSAR